MARLLKIGASGLALILMLLAAWSGVASGATVTSSQPPGAAMSCPHGETPAMTASTENDVQPPAGFNPALASDADLAKYGFPPRPKSGNSDGWLSAMHAWKKKAPANSPTWTCGQESHGKSKADRAAVPAGLGGGGTYTSYKWGGNQVSNSQFGDNFGDFPSASLEMNLPYPVSDPNGNYNYGETTFWTGIGLGHGTGSSGAQMVQNGVELDLISGQPYYHLWYEVFPQQVAQYIAPFTISPGDLLYFQSWFSGGTASFYFANLSHGQSVSKSEGFDGITGETAEWIVEKSGPVLTGWGPDNPFDMRAEFEDRNQGWFCAGTATHWSIHLLNSTSQDMAHGLAWVDPPSYCTFPLYRVNVYGG